jgi:hypothetical protein
MADVQDIAEFAHRREIAMATKSVGEPEPEPTNNLTSHWKIVHGGSSSGVLSAQVLRKLDPDTDLARFFDFSAQAIEYLRECDELLTQRDNLAADDKFMASKIVFAELLMFRDISDAVGLIALKLFQVATQIHAVTDTPELPRTMLRALHRIWAAPFMKFDAACVLADEIEEAAGDLILPGYAEVTAELIGDAEANENAQHE